MTIFFQARSQCDPQTCNNLYRKLCLNEEPSRPRYRHCLPSSAYSVATLFTPNHQVGYRPSIHEFKAHKMICDSSGRTMNSYVQAAGLHKLSDSMRARATCFQYQDFSA